MLIREGLGEDARQIFTSLIVPVATLEEMRWLNDLERVSASPETTAISMSPNLLPPITLVLHARGAARVPFEHG